MLHETNRHVKICIAITRCSSRLSTHSSHILIVCVCVCLCMCVCVCAHACVRGWVLLTLTLRHYTIPSTSSRTSTVVVWNNRQLIIFTGIESTNSTWTSGTVHAIPTVW